MATRLQPRFWRQLTGWIAVYALVLHGILVGFAGPQLSSASGTEICLHDAGGTLPSPSGDDGDAHCLLCLSVAHDVVFLARVSDVGFTVSATTAAFWPVAVGRSTGTPQRLAHRSRAPPVMA